MAREIRPPDEITDELAGWRLVRHATSIAEIVSRYTPHTERHVLECVMRIVGHLCAIDGKRNAENRGRI